MKFSLQTQIDWWRIMKLTFSHLLIMLILGGVSHASTGRAQGVLNHPVEISEIDQSLLTIKGKVTDEKGELLPGVSVHLKGTRVSTSTDVNGNYSIDATSGILVFTYIGYKTKEVAIGNSTTINVTLVAELTSLSEVVVVGYGTQSRKTVTGAISRVSGKDISALPVPDPRQALQGRVAGVTVTNNGSPGTAPIIRIRGIGSVNYASDPFYVIDGFPGADLGMIDSRDIQSIDVLRDASAAAIYGSRAANGVIMVTTKKANKGDRLKINFDTYYGSQAAWKKLDLLNTQEYVSYATALRTNAGRALPSRLTNLDDPIYAGATQTYRQTNTNWQDEIFRNAPVAQTNLSLSSASENSRLYFSAGHIKQSGIMLGTNYERYNFRINSDHTINKTFTFGQELTLAADNVLSENNAGGRTQIKHTIQNIPYIPVTDPFLAGGYRGPNGDDGSDPQNPVRVALQDQNRQNRLKLLGTAYVGVKLFDGLDYTLTGGINYANGLTRGDAPIYSESFNARTLHRVEQAQSYFRSFYISNRLDFGKTLGAHTFKVTAVAEKQNSRGRNLFGGGSYNTNLLNEVTNSLESAGVDGRLDEELLYSYLGRVNYSFADKYLLSSSFRRDGSSVWAPNHKWGNFPSASIGWRVSEENFLKDINALSELKLRGSWGKMGFNGIGNYAWQSVLSQGTAPILGSGNSRAPGAYFNSLGNEDLEWEITTMTNAGIDLGFWDNSLTLQAEYFVRNTENLILYTPFASSLGFSNNPPANVGAMRNKGYEFQAGYNKRKGDFNWSLSANLSFITNKVTDFGPKIKSPIYAGQNSDYGGYDITKTQVGDAVQNFYGWQVDGIFQNTAEIIGADGKPKAATQNLPIKDGLVDVAEYNKPANLEKYTRAGDIKFKDLNGDGVIDGDDRTNLGSFIPDFSYGFNYNANYKNIDVSLFVQGVQGNKIYNGTKVLTQGMLRLFGAGKEVLNAWTPQNTNTDIPRAVDGDPNNNSRTSDRFIEDGSYLRLKAASIGYNFAKATFLRNILPSTVSNARIYVSAQNLFTITKYSGYDPEVGSRYNSALTSGIDYGQFPQSRTFLFGLQVGF